MIEGAKTVIWNGPLGVCEFSYYSVGTEEIAKAIGSLSGAYTIVGGGDSVAAIVSLGLESKFSHISTGGGACLAMLEGSPLPGVEAIQDVNASTNTSSAVEIENSKSTKVEEEKSESTKVESKKSKSTTVEIENSKSTKKDKEDKKDKEAKKDKKVKKDNSSSEEETLFDSSLE